MQYVAVSAFGTDSTVPACRAARPGTAGVGGAAPQVDNKIPVDSTPATAAPTSLRSYKVALERVAYSW